MAVRIGESLARAGYAVDSSWCADEPPGDVRPGADLRRGRSASLADAWEKSDADLLVAVDLRMGYDADDVQRLIASISKASGSVVLASRCLRARGGLRYVKLALGHVGRWLTGSTDCLSGLVGIERAAFERLSLSPRGNKLGVELLLRSPNSSIEVPATGARLRRGLPSSFDDFSQLKRLMNHRRGDLSRLAQFCVVGASGMFVDLSLFAIFSAWLSEGWLSRRSILVRGEPLAWSWIVAAAISISVALVWNFTLNRRLTFSDSRHGRSIPRQFLTYALGNALAVSLSFLIRLGLPLQFDFFRDHRLTAAVVGVVVATGVSFSLSRWLVFRPRPPVAAKYTPAAHSSSTSFQSAAALASADDPVTSR